MEVLRLLRSYARAVWQYRPGLVAMAGGLMLARSLTEGAGLLLIVPLLAIAGFATGEAGTAVETGCRRFCQGWHPACRLAWCCRCFWPSSS
jgi:hypothetical protein